MTPIERKRLDKLPKVADSGSTTSKNVDWDSLREVITGNDLAYSTKDILDLSKEYSLIGLSPQTDKKGNETYDEEGFPIMNPPISQMRARDFLVKEWMKGRALKIRIYEKGKGYRVYYIFPLHGGKGKVRMGEEGCHQSFNNPNNRPEPKVVRGMESMEDRVLKKFRERRKKEKEIVE